MESINNEATEAQELKKPVAARAVYEKPAIVSFNADSTGKVLNSSEGPGDGHGPVGPS